MRTGALWAPAPGRVPSLAARASLASAPAACDWHAKMALAGDALGNDVLGNCVEARALRSVQLRTANALGSSWAPSKSEAIALYAQWAGYDPTTGAGDNGTDNNASFDRWSAAGIWPNPQLEDVPIRTVLDPANLQHMKAAIYHAGGVLLALNLPSSALNAAADGKPWTMTPGGASSDVPGSAGAHAVLCGRYDQDAYWMVTWGMQIPASPAFLGAYALGCDALVDRRWLDATGLTPPGLDYAALSTEVGSLAT